MSAVGFGLFLLVAVVGIGGALLLLVLVRDEAAAGPVTDRRSAELGARRDERGTEHPRGSADRDDGKTSGTHRGRD